LDADRFSWLRVTNSKDTVPEKAERVIYIKIPKSGEDYLLPIMEETLNRNGIPVFHEDRYDSKDEEVRLKTHACNRRVCFKREFYQFIVRRVVHF